MPTIPIPARPGRGVALPAFLFALFVSVVPGIGADTIPLPDIGASSGSYITPAEEQRLGGQFMRSVRRSLPLVDDPLLAEYIEGLGQRLASKADKGQRSFHFFLIDQPVVNAFAGPAGHIGIYTGLVLATEGESELASVVAHEMAHVTQDHLVRAFENASQMSGPTAALLLAAILLGTTVSSDLGMAAAAGVQAAAVQRQLNFTRENEEEADRVGIAILAGADFDPHSMPVFFERLSKSSRLYENNAPEFLRTHPVTSNRIADAIGRAEAYPYRQRPEDPDYHLVRAILRERSFPDPKEATKHFASTLTQGRYRDENAERYGYALALLRDHRLAQARKEADRLLRVAPTNIAFLLLDARITAESGQPERALKGLETALQLFPGNYPLASYYAELALGNGKPAGAARALDDALLRRQEDPGLLTLRSRAAAGMGNRTDAHLYLAEAHVLNGQLETAVQQLEVAVRSEKLDFYEGARLQAKLREFRRELDAEKEAKKNAE